MYHTEKQCVERPAYIHICVCMQVFLHTVFLKMVSNSILLALHSTGLRKLTYSNPKAIINWSIFWRFTQWNRNLAVNITACDNRNELQPLETPVMMW